MSIVYIIKKCYFTAYMYNEGDEKYEMFKKNYNYDYMSITYGDCIIRQDRFRKE